MAANGNKKHGTTKRKPAQVRYTAERRWESNKARRANREARRQSACKAVRSLAANAGERRPRDVSRRIRVMQRAA